MKELQDSLLDDRIEIDEDVTARHQIHLQKRRILHQVVSRENEELAHRLFHLEPVVMLLEVLLSQFLSYLRHRSRGVVTAPGERHRFLVDVGGEDLQRNVQLELLDEVEEQDGHAVRLLARGAARDPDAKWLARRPLLEPIREDPPQCLVRAFVPEERRDGDENLLHQALGLLGVASQARDVLLQAVRASGDESALEPTPNRGRFVIAKVHSLRRFHQLDDGLERIGRAARGKLLGRIRDERRQVPRELLWAHDQVDDAGRYRREGHSVVPRGGGGLGRHAAPGRFQRLHPFGAVGARSRKDGRDGPIGGLPRHGEEEAVDGGLRPGPEPGPAQAKPSLLEGDVGVGRGDVDGARFRHFAARNLLHGENGVAPKELGQHAPEPRRQVLDDDDRRPQSGVEAGAKLPERLQAARRRSDDHERRLFLRSGGRLRGSRFRRVLGLSSSPGLREGGLLAHSASFP